jgi:Methyltransferase domain
MVLDGLVFRLEHFQDDSWELGDECFRFYKVKSLVDQYAEFWALRQGFAPENVFELGIWDGGSVAFWFELFQPRKHVAVDLADRGDSSYFARYKAERNLQAAIATYWQTDQADGGRLREIAAAEFDGPIDLVIDDCSHLYAATRASFETLFPLLRVGGLYVIEDWAWSHWKEFQDPTHVWANEIPLTRLIVELVSAAGTSTDLIGSIAIYEGFAVVERGPASQAELGDFDLDEHISRRPQDR